MTGLSRLDFVRILGEDRVAQAEALSQEAFEEKKWDRFEELIAVYERVSHTALFEAKRSYITGLDIEMQMLLIRHTFDIENPLAAQRLKSIMANL